MSKQFLEVDNMRDDNYIQTEYVGSGENGGFRPSKLAEWYITACLGYLLVEAFFYNFIERALETRAYWFLNLTPWNTWPSVLWFFTFGLIFGVFICVSKKQGLVPIRGKIIFILLWLIFLFGALHGKVAGHRIWLGTFRQTIFLSLIAFWVVVLAQSVRYEVILSRFIKLSLPFAAINVFYAFNFFAGGAIFKTDSLFGASWKGTYVLILPYLAAFARSIAGEKNARFALIVLFCGILAPLLKPVLAAFIFANFMMLFLAFRLRMFGGDIRIGKSFMVVVILLVVGGIGGSIIFGLGDDAASRYLVDRIFKGGGGGKDLSGGRLEMWADCLGIWKENFVFGTGLGRRLYGVSSDGIPFALPVHNLYVQILMETGLVGLLILMLAIFGWVRRSFRTLNWEASSERQWPRLAIISWVLTILLTAFYGEPLANMPLAFLFWMMLAFESAAHSQVIQWAQIQEEDYNEDEYYEN